MEVTFTFKPAEAAAFLRLLENPIRLRVLVMISEREWDVGSLSKAIDLSQSALSQHLKMFRNAKIVETRREAQNIYYSCRDETVGKILKALSELLNEKPEELALVG